jgi:exopolysaccharide biosynthesis operon protein EpsL
MKNSIAFLPGSFMVFLAVIFPASTSFAALEKFDPYVFAGVRTDSNLFRSSDNEENETIWRLGAGFKSDYKLSRQNLILDLDVFRAMYDNFDELDYTGVDGLAKWKWQAGNLWSGNLGYKYNRSPRSYSQGIPGTITRDLDIRTRQTGYFDAGYQIHPDWRLIGGLELQDVSYQTRTRLDRESNSGLLEVQYQNTLNTRIGLRGKYAANDLNDSEIDGVSISNNYDVTTLSGVFYWEGSAKSALELRLGYTDLNYDELAERNFNGFSGRFIYKWRITGKTKMDISVWREPSNLNDEIQDYVLSTGLSIKPVWEATSKITVIGLLSYDNDDFKARNNIVEAIVGSDELGREDDTWVLGIQGKWNPRRYLDVSLGYRYENRDSTVELRNFDDHQVDANLKFMF